ncbi:MAG: hypothetical protein ACLGHC_06750, partial [Alphaproteobacteria bacterium]
TQKSVISTLAEAYTGSAGSWGHGGLLGTLAWVDPAFQRVRIFLTSLAPNRPEDAFLEARLDFMRMTSAAPKEGWDGAHSAKKPMSATENGLVR